ncbi:hypothetical protein ABZ490_28690 [Streptomyces sp. NPDC005811]|uniref:hypothetical protein n=1 Tax=Streptomyces sp. NPDC005811 TaxID=3154565 RepID=UPI0034094530
MSTQRTASGHTAPGQGWQNYNNAGIFIDVDTSTAGFTGNPTYVISLGGDGTHWSAVGASAVYSPTRTRFRVYLQWKDTRVLTPAHAAQYNFHINWIGIDEP